MPMRPLYILFLLFLIRPFSFLHAQDERATVRLIVYSDEIAVVRVHCYGHNERAVMDNCKKAPLQKLLYEGLEGLSDKPIVSEEIDPKQHLWLMKFFTEEAAHDNYDNYVEGIEVLGEVRSSSAGGYEGSAHVFLKYDRLLRKAKAEGLEKKAPTGSSGGGWL